MSYAEGPELNPYAAPTSAVAPGSYAQSLKFYGWAGFWRRFAAYFLDSIIMLIAAVVIGGVVGAIAGATGNVGPNGLPLGITLALQLVLLIMQVLYYAGMESSSAQATLGKQALGIKVTDLHGRRISFGRGVGRFFAKILSGLILLIGYIMAAFTDRKQALHDMVAGTLVVKAR